MRKVDDGKRKEKKITAKIVATNVVASRPPNGDRLQRRRLCQLNDMQLHTALQINVHL